VLYGSELFIKVIINNEYFEALLLSEFIRKFTISKNGIFTTTPVLAVNSKSRIYARKVVITLFIFVGPKK
jgi:hypothetical protein